MRNPNITPLEKCVLIDLLLYAGVDGEAFPSEKTLGRDSNRTDRHIRTIINSLKNKGLLIGWQRRGYSKSNQYILNPELYFRNESSYRKPTSVHLGNMLPLQSGNPLPPNIRQENNQLKNSYVSKGFIRANPPFKPCHKNGCNNGYIFHTDRQTYSLCECK